MFPLKYRPFGEKIVAQVGKILGEDPNNPKHKDSKFCVAMDLELRWVSTIGIGGYWWNEGRSNGSGGQI
jgi:hypothetical protein